MKKAIEEILLKYDIKINGNRPWDIIINDERVYDRLTSNIELNLGESYMDKFWDCEALDELFFKIFRSDLKNIALKNPNFWLSFIKTKIFYGFKSVLNFQNKKRCLQVAYNHYNLDTDLYKSFLDKYFNYSCGYWDKGAKNLDQAQKAKMDLICKKINLRPGMHILDIGCGWGGFAKYAAQKYKVSVVGLSISEQQIKFARVLCKGLPIKFKIQDYRDLKEEKFDRIISIGMFEHVGYKNYKNFMKIVSDHLKEDGLFLLHTIGSNFSKKCTNQWIDKYIFQNGQLPSIEQIGHSIENLFIMEDWHNLNINYDKTLMAWYKNFNKNWDNLKMKYDQRFKRMWNFYLLSSAGLFRSRYAQLWQIVFSKKGVLGGYQRIS